MYSFLQNLIYSNIDAYICDKKVPVNVPDLGLVDKEEAIDTEQRRLMRHVNASESKAQSNKSEAQIKKEEEDARAKAEEQARSDALVAKMQRKMAEHQASSHKPGATSSGLTVMTIEEETDEEARKRQAVANIANFIGK